MSDQGEPMVSARRAAVWLLRFLLVGGIYASLNLLASRFQVFPGVSMVFLAAAAGVVAAMVWRWETAAAVFVATFVTPWSPDNPVWVMLLYSVGNTVEAVLPALVLKPRRSTSDMAALAELALWTCGVNTLLNVAIGRGVRVALGMKPLSEAISGATVAWWAADAMAIAIFALPVLLWLRPELFFREPGVLSWAFLRSWRRGVVLVVLVAAVSWLIYLHDFSVTGSFNWPVLLLLIPLTLSVLESGLAGAAVTNALVALAYLTTVGFESVARSPGPLQTASNVVVVYGNLVFFLLFTAVAGTMSSRRLWLYRELERKWQQLEVSFEGTVKALAAAIEAKDPHTDEHLDRVSRLAEEVARRLGLPSYEVDLIRYGAILHDVGKIAVPVGLLAKPGPLTEAESEVMEQHLDVGARMLERTGLLEGIVPLVKYHEERWDGKTSGKYAGRFGLHGEEIPLGARIIAVADSFDAMTSDRPYRKARDLNDATEELKREAGKQFDPEVVKVFLTLLKERWAQMDDLPGSARWRSGGAAEPDRTAMHRDRGKSSARLDRPE